MKPRSVPCCSTDINEEGLRNYLWFSLKILTPNRVYQFEPDIRGRFNPEIDHIFPVRLKVRIPAKLNTYSGGR
jgi:hypothetical protein